MSVRATNRARGGETASNDVDGEQLLLSGDFSGEILLSGDFSGSILMSGAQ